MKTLNSCVKDKVKPDMSGGAIKDAIRKCAKDGAVKGKSIAGFPGSDGKWKLSKTQRGY